MRGENALKIYKVSTALTPSDSRSDSALPNLLSLLLPLNRQRIITSKIKMRVPVHPMSVL